MKPKAIIPLILGLGMGFMAIKMGMDLVKRAQAGASETVPVVVAARPIDAASRIEKDMLKIAAVPKALIPPGSFGTVDEVAARVSYLQISTGSPLSAEMLAPVGTEPGLPSQIPAGYRAISVRTDESTAVAGFVMPGHHVDIYAVDNRIQRNSGINRPISRLILEDVQVAAVGQSTKMVDPDGKSTHLTTTVTLYVKPDDLPSLDVASRETIRLVLRGSHEKSKALSEARDSIAKGFESLFSGMKARAAELPKPRRVEPPVAVAMAVKPAAEPAPKTHTVEVFHGPEMERITFGGPKLNERVSATKSVKSPTD